MGPVGVERGVPTRGEREDVKGCRGALYSLKYDGLSLISTPHERVDAGSKLVRMGLQWGFAVVVVRGVVAACLVLAL